jgi:hypothetical protein
VCAPLGIGVALILGIGMRITAGTGALLAVLMSTARGMTPSRGSCSVP